MSTHLNCVGQFTIGGQVNESLSLFDQSFSPTPSVKASVAYANGLAGAAAAIDEHYEYKGTLASGASLSLTLTSLTDLAERGISFARVRSFLIAVTSRQPGDYLAWGPDSVNGWTAYAPADTMLPVYRADGFCVDQTDSLPVAEGSNDRIKITNQGTSPINFNLMIQGNHS